VWGATAQETFEKHKEAMSATPVLALPDFTKQFVVETDASDAGFRAVLMQEDAPLAFLRKLLSSTNKFLSIYEKEFLALIMAVKRWHPYLQMQEFLIRTNHKSLAYLNEHTLQSDLQHKAMTILMGLQFKIVYKKCKENVAADALSKVTLVLNVQSYSVVKPIWIQEVVNSYSTDTHAQDLLA
jgi:hypothetical protein